MDNLLPPPPPPPPFPFVGPLPPLPPPSPPPPPDIPMPPKAPNAHRPSTAMKEYFNSEKHSDVTVRFGGKEVKAHKIALCSHSKFFAQCCEGQFEEASSNVIELKDDDPATVQAMLEHLYGIDYQEGDAKELLKSDSFSMPFHLRVYITADKYDVPSLKDEASSNFSLGARRVMKALRGSPTFKKQKKLTPHKMEEIDALASAIRVVFNNTGESDDLRETCTSVLLEHEFGLWRADEVMKNLFDDVPELAVSLAKRKFCLQSHKSLMTVQCPDCDKVFSSELPFWGGAHCISCGAWTSNWSRHEYYGSRPTTMSKFLHSSRWRFWNHIHFPRIRIHISRVRDSDVSDMSEV